MADGGAAVSLIELTEATITCHRVDGSARLMRRDDLRGVLIETTDQGPFVEDVWWILIDSEGHCIISQEVGGEALLAWLQELPGFDNEAVIAAMASVENQLFTCWQRPSQ